jgi:hypothetical protein
MRAVIGIFVVTFTLAMVAAAVVIHVPGDYSTIQAGVNAAANGDTVLVAPGTYVETVTIQNAAIHLLSSGGADVTTISRSGSGSYSCLVVSTSSEISGFKISRSAAYYSDPAVQVQGGNPYFHHNLIISNSEGPTCVRISGSGSPIFLNNTLYAWDDIADFQYGFHINNPAANPSIKNNIVVCQGADFGPEYTIYNQAGAVFIHTYNDFWTPSGSGLQGVSLELGEIAAHPQWVGGGSYHLQATSPCIDAGIPTLLDPDSTRSDMGYIYFPQVTFAPTITSTPDTMTYAGYPYLYQLVFTANPYPSFQLLSGPLGMTVSDSGLITWNVPGNAQGDYPVSVRAYNILGQDQQNYILHVLPNINLPPEIISYTPVNLDSVDFGQTVTFSATAVDPNADPLSYLWKHNGVVVSQDTICEIPFIQVGNHLIRLYVSDGFLLDSLSWQPYVPGHSVSGNVSGIWSPGAGPYVASANLVVPAGQTLVVQPGVVVYFGADQQMTVNGTLTAVGTVSDSVIFQSLPGIIWTQLVCSGNGASMHLTYAVVRSASQPIAATSNADKIRVERSRLEGVNYAVYATSFDSLWVEKNTVVAPKGIYAGGQNCFSHLSDNAITAATVSSSFHPSGIRIAGYTNHAIIDSNRIFVDGAAGGEGVFIWPGISDIIISRNLIEMHGSSPGTNTGIYLEQAYVQTITHNTVYLWNGGNGILIGYNSTGFAWNNIFCAVNGNIGIYAPSGSPQSQADYNDIWGFASPSYGFPFGARNITQDPLFVGGNPYDYSLQSASPCIDAGDPLSAPDPDFTRADMGAYYYPRTGSPALNLTLTPINPPIQIPATGGGFNYIIAAENIGTVQLYTQIWCEAVMPNGSLYGPVLGPVTINLSAGSTISRQRTQNVPYFAPAGNYTYQAKAGVYPDILLDQDSFPFTKLTTGSGDAIADWMNSGEPFDADVTTKSAAIPDHFVLLQNFPNPFNPVTTISFTLPQTAPVQLAIFDVQGRLVQELLRESRDAGFYSVTWDATDLASGLYFCRIQAGNCTDVKKLMLLK